jgi:predicted enzyme related to lactoylglutathione lyase
MYGDRASSSRYHRTSGHDNPKSTADSLVLVMTDVPEPMHGKNWMHVDLLVDNLDAEVARLHALGATTVSPSPAARVRPAMVRASDPEGNEFCVVTDPNP